MSLPWAQAACLLLPFHTSTFQVAQLSSGAVKYILKVGEFYQVNASKSADVFMYHLSVGSGKLNATATHITQIHSKSQFLALRDCSF